MECRDLQIWTLRGAMNRGGFLVQPAELTVAIDPLSAHFIGSEGRGGVALQFNSSFPAYCVFFALAFALAAVFLGLADFTLAASPQRLSRS